MHALETALLLLVLLFPIADIVLERYKFHSKRAEYIKSAAMLWLVTLFLLFCFFKGVLNISAPHYLPTQEWKGILATISFVVFIGYLKFVLRAIDKDEKVRRDVLKAFEDGGGALNDLLPETRKELLLFTLLLSVSAGVCEELIFRWYLYGFIEQHAGGIVAIACSSLIFGLWHLYLGWKHVIKTAFVGAVFCGIYLYFDSIVVAIIAHILMDVYSGTLAYVARKSRSLHSQ
jgi:membrane protease YdiL (CAAX protease family)